MILRKSGVFNISFLNDYSETAIAVNTPPGYKNIVAGVSPSFTLVNSGIPFNYHLFQKYTTTEYDTSDSSDTKGRSFSPFVVE
jgi:hypothetical protein